MPESTFFVSIVFGMFLCKVFSCHFFSIFYSLHLYPGWSGSFVMCYFGFLVTQCRWELWLQCLLMMSTGGFKTFCIQVCLLSSQGKQENSYNYLFLVGVSRYLCLFQHFCYIIDRSKRETKQSNDSSNCLPGWRPAVCLIHIVLFRQPFTISLGDHATAYVGMKKEKFNIHVRYSS